VFGNLLKSLLTLDTQPFEQRQSSLDQYHPDFILWELNKAYTGFHCQQDRGDISTDLLALTVKRGSLAFVAEDYPECGAPFRITSRQSDLGNIPMSVADYVVRGPMTAALMVDGMSSPLSPIAEISETPSFSSVLAEDILQASLKQVGGTGRQVAKQAKQEKRGGVEDVVAEKLIESMFENPADLVQKESTSSVTTSVDGLATTLVSSIMKASAEEHAEDVALRNMVRSTSAEELEEKSNSIAKCIIGDVLASPPLSPKIRAPQTVGEPTPSSLSSYAADISGSILLGALEKSAVQTHSPIAIQVEGKERRISSLTSTKHVDMLEFINDVTSQAIQDGISMIQASPATAGLEKPPRAPQTRTRPQTDPPGIDVARLAKRIVVESIQNGLKRVKPEVGGKEGAGQLSSHPPSRKRLVRQALPLGISADGTSPVPSSPSCGSPIDPPPTQSPVPGSTRYGDPDGGETHSSSNMNARLLTPMSSRAGYAWSIASTRDDDSRPVSPTDLNKLGLSLSNNTDEFSSLFSDIVINNAISKVTGENASPHAVVSESQDHTSLPSSSKIGIYLSKLKEAETPQDQGVTLPYNTTWQTMRRQLLRPITTGLWKCGGDRKVQCDPQLMAMVQWMAASASGRPRLFYYSLKDDSVREVMGEECREGEGGGGGSRCWRRV
jgi:hypothetical protein